MRPIAAGARNEALRDDALERSGEHRSRLVQLGRREEVEDPVDRFRRIARVDRRENQMACLSRRECTANRRLVPHLADQNDVGVLPHDASQRGRERGGVAADLALIDRRLAVSVQVLDRVFDCDDVLVAGVVDVFDHRRERRRFSRSCCADHEDQSPLLTREFGNHRGKPEIFQRANHVRDRPEHERHRSALEVGVGAKAPHPRHAVGEIDLVLGLECFQARLRQYGVQNRHGVGGTQRGMLSVQSSQFAVDADQRGTPHLHAQVRATALEEPGKHRDNFESPGIDRADLHCRPNRCVRHARRP